MRELIDQGRGESKSEGGAPTKSHGFGGRLGVIALSALCALVAPKAKADRLAPPTGTNQVLASWFKFTSLGVTQDFKATPGQVICVSEPARITNFTAKVTHTATSNTNANHTADAGNNLGNYYAYALVWPNATGYSNAPVSPPGIFHLGQMTNSAEVIETITNRQGDVANVMRVTIPASDALRQVTIMPGNNPFVSLVFSNTVTSTDVVRTMTSDQPNNTAPLDLYASTQSPTNVFVPPQLLAVNVSTATFPESRIARSGPNAVTVSSVDGRPFPYGLETAPSVSVTNWQTVPDSAGTNSVVVSPSVGSGFFRVKLVP